MYFLLSLMFGWFLQKFDKSFDFTGQYVAERCLYTIFILGYSLSFFAGVILYDLKYTLYGAVATILIAFLVVVPSWPCFRKNPEKFVEPEKVKDE